MRTLFSLAACCLSLLSASHAYALSCTRDGFDLEKNFTANESTGESVIYALGSFSETLERPKLEATPKADNSGITIINQNPQSITKSIIFSGKVMTKHGVKPFKQKVEVTSSCAASWCGNIPQSGQSTIAAFTKINSGYAINAGPCNPNTFSNQIQKDWAKLKQLLR